uniref:Uncharacterized protein n=1 Tax=Leptobrachium leishanense TaxID=445787 RepID=A0A8C5Q723_9ANUR
MSNNTDCWICGAIAFSEESSYPYVGVPWTVEDLKAYNNTGFGWYREAGKPRSMDRIHIVNRPQEGAVCISSHDSGIHVLKLGQSNCTAAWLKGYGNDQNWAMTADDSSPVITIVRMTPHGPIRRMTFPFLSNLLDTCFNKAPGNSYNVLPRGVYFLCGNWAYRWLPPSWEGECYLGSIVPAIRRRENLPEGLIRNKRWSSFIGTHEGNSGVFFPSWGVYWSLNRIEVLKNLMDEALNATVDSIMKLSQEQVQIRAVALQNRQALDYVLAAKGGVCALIGTECCVYIVNNSGTITHDLARINKVREMLRNPPDDGPFGWLGNLGIKLMQWAVVLIIICISLYVCVMCIMCLGKKVLRKARPLREVEMYEL